MNGLFLSTLLVLSASLNISGQETAKQPDGDIQTVDYCELRKTPELYNGKTIRVSGIYVRGFEMSAFYSTTCINREFASLHETWVDGFYRAKIARSTDVAAIVKTFLSGKGGSELEVTVTGVFRGSKEHGGFGHLNGARFQIEVATIDDAKLLPVEVSGCQRIDRTKPFHYVSLEKIENGTPPAYEAAKKPEKEKLVYLRLANNSTCSIKLPTARATEKNQLVDQSEVPILYTLSSICSRVSSPSITKTPPILAVLLPGQAVYFAVPLRFLTKEPFDIRIPFDNGFAKGPLNYQPLYFWRSDLPKEFEKDIDCTKY